MKSEFKLSFQMPALLVYLHEHSYDVPPAYPMQDCHDSTKLSTAFDSQLRGLLVDCAKDVFQIYLRRFGHVVSCAMDVFCYLEHLGSASRQQLSSALAQRADQAAAEFKQQQQEAGEQQSSNKVLLKLLRRHMSALQVWHLSLTLCNTYNVSTWRAFTRQTLWFRSKVVAAAVRFVCVGLILSAI